MKFFRKYFYIILFITLYTNAGLWDYFGEKTIHWKTNFLETLFFTMFYVFFNWLWDDKDKKKERLCNVRTEDKGK